MLRCTAHHTYYIITLLSECHNQIVQTGNAYVSKKVPYQINPPGLIVRYF